MMMVRIGDVWDRTTEFLSDHLRAIVPIAIVAILIPSSITSSLAEVQASGSQQMRLGFGVLSLVFAIVSLWGQLAISSLAIDGVGARRATERLLPAIGVYLLLLLVASLIVAAVILPMMFFAGYDFSQVQWGVRSMQPLSGPGRYWLLLAFLTLSIVIIAVLVRLMPLTGVIVAERRGVGAIGRAFRLTRGIGFKLFGVLLLYLIVSLVAQWAATAVFGSVMAVVAGGEGPLTVARVVTSVITAAVGTAFTVLAAAFTAKLYMACVRARDAIDPPAAAAPLP